MFDNRWDNWAGDFAESFAASTLDPATRDRVPEILHHFGEFARRLDSEFPDRVAPDTLAVVFREHLPRLDLAPAVRDQIPEVVARFFEFLQDGGRLGEGYACAERARAIRVPPRPEGPARPAAAKVATIRKANSLPVGRNDPCPCGSGKKYKKCCHA